MAQVPAAQARWGSPSPPVRLWSAALCYLSLLGRVPQCRSRPHAPGSSTWHHRPGQCSGPGGVVFSLAADRINNPPADGLASPIARVSKLFPPVLRFLYPPRRRSAPASDWRRAGCQFSGIMPGRLSGKGLCMVNPTGIASTCGKSVSRRR